MLHIRRQHGAGPEQREVWKPSAILLDNADITARNIKAGVELPLGCRMGGEHLEQTAGQHSIALALPVLAAAGGPRFPLGMIDVSARPPARAGDVVNHTCLGRNTSIKGMDDSPEDTTGSLWRRLEVSLGFLNHGQELQPQELSALSVITLKQ